MSILLVAGSPAERSTSAALLDAVNQRLGSRGPLVERVHIRNLSPQALLLADTQHRTLRAALDAVRRAVAIVVATPVHKATYSGVLKLFLDLLPHGALEDKVVLPLAAGASPLHMLALDHALRPVLESLGAHDILPGIYATDSQLRLLPGNEGFHLSADIGLRLDDAVLSLLREHRRLSSGAAGLRRASVEIVQCTV